jgi:hypothetical protein
MLTADQLDKLTGPITDLYEQYNQSVINDISRRLVKMGKVTETAAWQMQRLIESGRVYENALKELAKTSGLSENEMRRMFEEAGVKSMRFDDSIYQAAGLNPLPLNLSPTMAQVLAAGLRKTNGLVKNLTMTTAINAQHSFIQAADLAYMQVASGAMSYDQAIRAAVQDVAEKGLNTINYASGRKEQLDVAMRRMVLTGVSQTTGNLQMARADDMGVDLVQTSAHIGARPAHQLWQGKIFSRSGTSKTYPDFVLSTGYGTGAGLMGWNCRHSFYPFFEGISENAYSQAELDSYAGKTVTYNGQEIPIYDATQMQRGIERKIRLWKRKEGALDAGGFDNEAETAKVKEWQSRMRDFIKQTGLQRQSVREQVVGAGDAGTKVAAKVTVLAPSEIKPQEIPAPVLPNIEENKLPIYEPDTNLVDEIIKGRVEGLELLGMNAEEVKKNFTYKFTALVKNPDTALITRARYKDAIDIVNDGRFKTQFETGTSQGLFDTKARAEAEFNGIGIPKDLDEKLRPIYGYVHNSSIYNGNPADRYGEIKFVFDKERVTERASFTIGDSLASFAYKSTTASPITNPSIASATDTFKLIDFLSGQKLDSYIELQIQNGVELSEIKAVIIPKYYGRDDILGNLLRSKGIDVIYE